MAKVPKHRRIKRATVLIKRSRCIRSTKNKSYSPLYQKLKVNNHSLARALSQEKQESQLLFSRNVELLAEVQDLVHACNKRDTVISNIVKNSKDMMQMLVSMSGLLSNTISSCQEFVSNQVSLNQRTSTSSTGRRESSRRVSTKSPARGVVKPMVSGHTITKPTINLSRVNMQRLQNVNLSIIEEGPTTPERNLERSVESRHSRTLPERLQVPACRTEVDDEERIIVNRRTSRFSGGRLSSGRYSKRNSGRLSGGGLAGRLSKRSSEYNESIKSPRVTLQDVSRYMANNQTVNIRLLSQTTTGRNGTSVEDTRLSEESSPEDSNHVTIIPETQDSCETSDSDSQDDRKRISGKKPQAMLESHFIDPLEGPSWLYDSATLETSSLGEESSSPVSSFRTKKRRSSTSYFRVPELPKAFEKATHKLNDDSLPSTPASNGIAAANFRENDEDVDDDGEHRVDLRYITQRRGPSSRAASYQASTVEDGDEDENEEDDETLMLNMRRQMGGQLTQQLGQPERLQFEQPERLQFDVNELLQLTPLKPLLNIGSRTNNGPTTLDVEPERTATVQLTQRCAKPTEGTDNFSLISTIRINPNSQAELPPEPTMTTVRGQDVVQDRRFSELSTARFSSRIELPRLTNVFNTSDINQQSQILLTPENAKQLEKRKRIALKQLETTHSANEDNVEEAPVQNVKKPKQRKKKTKDKDPSTAKVVLQKLNESSRVSLIVENTRPEMKNSDESISSLRSSTLSRADQSSDSENSNASFSSKVMPLRPRRQKAPKNLREPNLTKKLRR